MKKVGYNEALGQILKEDSRYDVHCYHFIKESLDFTIKDFAKPPEGPGRHVSGAELLEGIRKFALQEFGPLARTVLSHWGIHETQDFGHVVFNLVEKGLLGKTEDDNLEDFADGYDFDEAFRTPFLPVVEQPVEAIDPDTH